MENKLPELNFVCYGEVLYDVFPTHRKIGGAPLNVALRLVSLGLKSQIISAVGRDKIGSELLEYVQQNGVNSTLIQTDDRLNTGEVIVELNEQGAATYTINYPVAWDKIKYTSENKIAVKNATAFVYGSLVCRDPISHQTLVSLLSEAQYKIFDVNLRAPFYDYELLINLMKHSDFIKFNDEELLEISDYMGSPYKSLEENMLFIADKTSTSSLCVTKGSQGAVLYYNKQFFYNTGYKIQVADTVGAGDSFLAGLLNNLFTQNDPQKAVDFACALGALVAEREGANPVIEIATITNFMNI